MSNTFLWIAIFAISAAVINTLGILTILKYRKFAEKAKTYFMCFAAGVLISTPLMIALPTAIKKTPYAGFVALVGFLFMFFSNKIVKYYTKEKNLAFGITAVEGIGIHSFIDGIIYTITFSVSILIGVLAGVGLVIHEFAEGIITYMFLIKGKIKEKKAAFYAFLIAALTTPIGAFVVYPFVSKLGETNLGLMLGFVSGILLYVSAAHILPEAMEEEKKHSTLAFLAGIALALFIMLSKLI